MLNGAFEHEDSMGSKGKMTAGAVQWMKTGRGIIHSEMPAMSGGKLLGFQLWINMPAKLKKINQLIVLLMLIKSDSIKIMKKQSRLLQENMKILKALKKAIMLNQYIFT